MLTAQLPRNVEIWRGFSWGLATGLIIGMAFGCGIVLLMALGAGVELG